MIIRKYGDLPVMYTPDVHEVVHARRSVSDKYVRAVVMKIRRRSADLVEFKVCWLETDLAAVFDDKGSPVMAGEMGSVYTHPARQGLLIKRLDKGGPPNVSRETSGGPGPATG